MLKLKSINPKTHISTHTCTSIANKQDSQVIYEKWKNGPTRLHVYTQTDNNITQ